MEKDLKAEIHSRLMEISYFVFVLQMALQNQNQPTKDTTPYSDFTSIISNKINELKEILSCDDF